MSTLVHNTSVSVEANLRSKLSPNGAAATKTARVGESI